MHPLSPRAMAVGLLSLALLGSPGAAAETLQPLGNFRTTPLSGTSAPQFGATVGPLAYYFSPGPSGNDLWRTDGTAAGTRLVKELAVSFDSFNRRPVASGGLLYFLAISDLDYTDLWRSDGTTEGTRRVADLHLPSYSPPSQLTDAAGTLFFAAGGALWKTDGTEQGTVAVAPQGVSAMVSLGPLVYFASSDPYHGREVWRSDGTLDGTWPLDVLSGTAGLEPTDLVVFGGSLYFLAGNPNARGIWKTDGTVAGTTFVSPVVMQNPVAAGSRLFFDGFDSANGRELWTSDGSPAGTAMVQDVSPGSTSTNFVSLVSSGDAVYFVRSTSTGNELWKSDGSAQGTVKVGSYSSVNALLGWRGLLFFSTGFQVNLSRTDGTSGGTFTLPVRPASLLALGERLLVLSSDLANHLYGTDGTVEGTSRYWPVALGDTGSLDGGGSYKDLFPGHPHFCTTSPGVFATDGTPAGTVPSQDTGGVCPGSFRLLGDRLIYRGQTTTSLWARQPDGAQVDLGTSGAEIARAGDRVIFVNGSLSLMATDGTPAGTQELKRYEDNKSFDSFVEVGGAAFARRGFDEMWRTDGTPAGTSFVKSFSWSWTGRGNGNGLLYFTTNEGYGDTLWRSDGTPAGTVVVKSFAQQRLSSSVATFRGRVYFGTGGNDEQAKLWSTDGTGAGTVLLHAFSTRSRVRPAPASFTVSGTSLFFTACDASGCELWTTDGTPAVTRGLDLYPGWQGSAPSELRDVGGLLLFTAADESRGREPWRSDGTPEGTWVVGDIAPGPRSSLPRDYLRAGARAVLIANDGAAGFEPWAMSLPLLPALFHPVAPCRAVDTRGPDGLRAGPALQAGTPRTFPLTGTCGVPGTARALAVNVTMVTPENGGDLQLFPAGTPAPPSTVLSFRAGGVRAGSSIVKLGATGAAAAICRMPQGSAHLLIDVSGYFE